MTVKGKEAIGANRKPFLIKETDLLTTGLSGMDMFKFDNAKLTPLMSDLFIQPLVSNKITTFWKNH